MSEYWLNRIGIASSVTTPTGSVPQYGLAADIGTAQWPDSATFNQWAQDAVATERAGEIAEAEYEAEQADESGWFQNLLKDFTGAIGQIDLNPFNGSNQGIISEDEFESAALKPEDYERGGERMEAFANAPGIKQLNQAWEAGTRPVETGFLMYRNAEMRRRLGGFFDRSSWGAAWREAEERTLGEAFADAMFVEYGDTNADLDRRRRTNSLYGMTAFASELYAGFKADPTVIAGKGLGEVGRIKRGELPRGYTSTKAAAAATKAARAEDPSAVAYDGGLLERYGTWRGKTVASRYDALRVLAENMDFTEFSNLPMFRRKAVNGPQAALAFKIAAKDDKLWDLTRRATLADPEAWAEINAMKAGLTDELNAASGTDAANYIDAIEATKTKMGQLDNEIADLEKKIALREELGPQSPTGRPGKGINEGFFKYHTWELDRDLESKMLDVANMDAMLNRYDDYATWLGKIEDEGVWANVEGVSTKGLPDRLNYVNSKTYQKSPFGPVHRVSEITRAGWLRTANAIDLHRVDSGTMSIRRQFEQFAHFFNYYDRAAMDDAMVRFTKAKDPLERFKIAREIEDTHLPQAVAQKYGLEPETVDAFLRQTRLRRNEMAEALLSGKGAVYDTTPGLADSAELVAVKDGMATVRVMDNGKLHTMRLPEEALQPQPDLPVDITQTPNYYSPMDTRQVDLAIKRNPELFELLDGDIRNGARKAAGKTMETVDQFGTAWNSVWKPLQLFRLAWPQRVLMDEWFRGMAALGATRWGKAYFPAMRDATLNALNPTLHGPYAMIKRRRVKVGPGPLADEVIGRRYDVPTHEAMVENSPVVPEELATNFNPKRVAFFDNYVSEAVPDRAARARARALLRNPNATRSLPDDADAPFNWFDIDDTLWGGPVGTGRQAISAADRRGPGGRQFDPTLNDLDADFDATDFPKAYLAMQMSDADVMAYLGGGRETLTGNAKIEAFLELDPRMQRDIWNGTGDVALMENFAEFSHPMVQQFANSPDLPFGSLRDQLTKLVREGKRRFDADVAKAKKGAGHGPLFSGTFRDIKSAPAKVEMLKAQALGAKYVPVDERLAGLTNYGVRRVVDKSELSLGVGQYVHKRIFDAMSDASRQPGEVHLIDAFGNGKQIREGFAVKVAEMETPEWQSLLLGDHGMLGDLLDEMDNFFGSNADYLKSSGFRLLLDGKKLSVVRYFRSSEKAQAINFAHHVEADEFYKLGGAKPLTSGGKPVKGAHTRGHKVYIRDANDRSPILEELERRFKVDQETEFVPGEAPIAGRPHVYHGTERTLPEQLAPRIEAPSDHGQLYGQGLYTTMSREVAESYGSKLYTIRGSRSGKEYKVLDLEVEAPHQLREELADFIADYYAQIEEARPGTVYHSELEAVMDTVRPRFGSDYSLTWGGLMEQVDWQYVVPGDEFLSPQQLITKYIEERGYGALTHTGGLRIGGFGEHQVFIWLHPEDLMVRPAYEKTGRFYALEEWLGDPRSQERLYNPVPESRIVRRGKMDPKFRELETIHRKIEQLKWGDPKKDALLGREQAIMRRLGLEYTHNLDALKKQGKYTDATPSDHWYTQIDRQRPAKSQMQDAARAELAARGPQATTDVGTGDLSALGAVDTTAEIRKLLNRNHVQDRYFRKIMERRQYGTGKAVYRSDDGADVEVQDIFEGEGGIYVPLTSAAPTYARLSDTYKRTLSRYRQKALGYKRVARPDLTAEGLRTKAGQKAIVDYYGNWSDLVNDHLRNSPIVYKMLAGESDDAIVDWLTKSEEGARIRRQLPHKARHPERWVEELRDRLNYYVPNTELQKLLAKQQVTPHDLQRFVPDEYTPDEIYAPDLEMVLGEKGWGKEIAAVTEKIYHGLGTVPTDLLSRQPFAKAMYDLKMRNLIRSTKSEWLTPETLKQYEKLSREFAVRQIRRTLYDLTDETNMTQALRFMAPFWGAQQEAIVKWFGLAVENPETVARFYVGLDRTYEQFLVVDEDNLPVESKYGHYRPNDRVILQIPNNLKKLPFFKKALEGFGSVGVSFSSANTALQGDQPFLPSLGPIVTVPAQILADEMWDTHGTQFDDEFFYRWLFPVGRPSGGITGVMEQVFPGWGRRMLAMQQGSDSTTWMNTWFTVQRELTWDAQKKGLPPPSPEEIERAARWHFGLRTIAAFGAPAAMEFRPENQFFLDEYHKMIRDYGPGKAFEKFVEQYGTSAAQYAASSSNGLVPPTAKGMEEWDRNKALMRDIAGLGPEFEDLAGLVISPDAWADDFSSDSYREQFSIPVGPGSKAKLRESQDPITRAVETEKRVGWIEYRKFMSTINAELYNRGLTSLEQKGAEDLADTKRAFVMEMEQKYPSWSTDFRSYSDTIYQRVGVMRSFAFEPRFDNRPDIQGLRQYLMIRDSAAQSLDQWAAQGGSRSLQAEENTQLRNWYYDQVGQLIQANPAFGELYVRFLESDRLERGSGP